MSGIKKQYTLLPLVLAGIVQTAFVFAQQMGWLESAPLLARRKVAAGAVNRAADAVPATEGVGYVYHPCTGGSV